MHWVIQEDFYHEPGYEVMLETLRRFEIPHSVHKVVPFVGDIVPDVTPVEDEVIVIGSYSMRHVAARKGWTPGSYSMEHAQFLTQKELWGPGFLLNGDARVMPFNRILNFMRSSKMEDAFVRPLEDSKTFAGTVMSREHVADWTEKLGGLGLGNGSTMDLSTLVMVAEPKNVLREYRTWVVDGRVVTTSLYKMGNRVTYSPDVEEGVADFAQRIVDKWNPARAFVLDVALVDGNYKVIEAQCINASGFYAADVQRLVLALDG